LRNLQQNIEIPQVWFPSLKLDLTLH
jgi:hypothetical protein